MIGQIYNGALILLWLGYQIHPVDLLVHFHIFLGLILMCLMAWLVRLVTPPGGLVLDPHGQLLVKGCQFEEEMVDTATDLNKVWYKVAASVQQPHKF